MMNDDHALMEICTTPDCSEYGGGWIRCRLPTKAAITDYMNSHEPGECPGCVEPLHFEVGRQP